MMVYLSRRNSLRGRLLLGGMLFYFFYKYMQYAVMVALTIAHFDFSCYSISTAFQKS